jgi:hypothetical protein
MHLNSVDKHLCAGLRGTLFTIVTKVDMTNRLKLTGNDKFLSVVPVNRLQTVNYSCSKMSSVQNSYKLLQISLEFNEMHFDCSCLAREYNKQK